MKTVNEIANDNRRRSAPAWSAPGWLAALAGCVCWMTTPGAALAAGGAQEIQEEQKSGQVDSGQESVADSLSNDADSNSKQETEKKKVEWPQSEDGWYIVTPEGGDSSFSVPAEPHSSKRDMVTVDDLPITVHLNVAIDQNRANMVFAWHDQGLPRHSGDVARTLQGAFVGALGMTLGEEISKEEVRVHRFPGLDFQIRFIFKDQTMKMASRVVLIQGRVYQLTYIAPEDVFSEEDHKKFVESFQYTPPPKQPASEKPDSEQPAKSGGQ